MSGEPRHVPMVLVKGRARRAGYTLCQLSPPQVWGLLQKRGRAPVARFTSLEAVLQFLETQPALPESRLRY